MNSNQKWWVFTIAFWVLFFGSVGLGKRYPWLDTVWTVGLFLLIVVASVFSVAEMVRHRNSSGEYVYFHGMPRFMRWFVVDDEQYAKEIARQKAEDAKRFGTQRD